MSSEGTTGSTTQQVYTFIQEQKYKEAIQILTRLKSQFPQSRAANSLLAYCYFCSEEYELAAEYYENLSTTYPTVKNYRLSFIQSLYKAGKIDEAERQCFASRMIAAEDPDSFSNQLYLLHAMIKYNKDDLPGAQNIIRDQCDNDDQDVKVLEAAIVFKQGRYDAARDMLIDTIQTGGYQPHIAYNIALCHFMLKQYTMALKSIDDIQEKANRDYQEQKGYLQEHTDTIPFDPVFLKDAMLIEALNLKAAIEYQLREGLKARAALEEMPQREEYQLDQVTLHNTAILTVEDDNEAAIDKLFFLLSRPPCPRETLGNLLILLCKNGDYQKASELLQAEKASSSKLTGGGGKMIGVVPVPPRQQARLKTGLVPSTALRTATGTPGTGSLPLGAPPKTAMEASVLSGQVSLSGSSLSPQLRDFVTASILMQTPGIESNGIEAFRSFQQLAVRQFDDVQKTARALHELKGSSANQEQTHLAYRQNQDAIQRYAPTMMSMAKIFWDQKKYAQTATVLQQCKDVCGDSIEWMLNMAHTYFVQEKYREAIDLYRRIVEKQSENSILDVTPVVLANLCVCHVMSDNNAAGEEIIMKVDEQEKALASQDPTMLTLHSCVIDLVVGTLYCSRRTFQFGISRTIKSFQPVDKKLTPGTWFYAKRNFVFLCENIAKMAAEVQESQQQEILRFLDVVDECGKEMLAENADEAAAQIYEGEFPGKDKKDTKSRNRSDSAPSAGGAPGADPNERRSSLSRGAGNQRDKPGTPAVNAQPALPLTVSDEARLIKRMFLQLWALS